MLNFPDLPRWCILSLSPAAEDKWPIFGWGYCEVSLLNRVLSLTYWSKLSSWFDVAQKMEMWHKQTWNLLFAHYATGTRWKQVQISFLKLLIELRSERQQEWGLVRVNQSEARQLTQPATIAERLVSSKHSASLPYGGGMVPQCSLINRACE